MDDKIHRDQKLWSKDDDILYMYYVWLVKENGKEDQNIYKCKTVCGLYICVFLYNVYMCVRYTI